MKDLTLVYLPGDRRAKEIVPDQDPTTGVIAATCPPGRSDDRVYPAAQTLLRGFGVRDDVSGHGRSLAEDRQHLLARFHSYSTRLVVLRHVDWLGPRPEEMLNHIRDLLAEADVSLVLTCDETAGMRVADWVEANQGRLAEYPDEAISGLDRPAPVPSSDAPRDFPVALPRADFYIFRARCREVLTEAAYRLVDDLYVRTARQTMSSPFRSAEEANDRILDWAASCDTTPQFVTMVRAAQAAMFRHAMLLKVDLDVFTRRMEDGQHRPLKAIEVQAMRAYRNTTISTAVVLGDIGLSSQEATDLRIDEIAADGSQVGGEQVPEHSREFIRTHLALRRLSRATGDDPFLNCKTRFVLDHRRTVAAELGLPSVPKQVSVSIGQKGRWTRDLGLSLQPLTGPVAVPSTEKEAA